MIKKDYVSKGSVVIDVGIHIDTLGNINGDVCFEEVKDQCSYITPVPGGIGLVTTTVLVRSVLHSALSESEEKNGMK